MADDQQGKWIVPTEGAKTLPAIEILTGRGFITGKSGSGKSVLEGTPVYTEDGRKPIEAVAEGDRVLSLDRRTYEQEFREVQATLRHTADRLLRITLEDGTELVGTEDHSFLTAKGLEIVPVRGTDIEEGTWMPLSRRLPQAETVQRIDLAEYSGNANNLVIEADTISSGGRTEDRHLELDFETGTVIGLYLAEGSFDAGMTLQIANVDAAVQSFLGSWGFNVYERTCNLGFRPLARFLEAEFGTGSGDKSLPNWVFDAPAPFQAGLLSGYIDGDGTVESSSVTALSKSPELLEGLKELLRQFGVSATIRDTFTVYAGEERRYRRLSVDSFTVDRFAEVVDLTVEEKREGLAALRDRLEEGAGYNSKDTIPNFGPVLNAAVREQGWNERDGQLRADGASVHQLTRKQEAGRRTYNRLVDELDIHGRAAAFGRSDVQWKRVVDVEELTDERAVYDLDVRHNDNFVANGAFVHNSNTGSVIAEGLLDNNYNLLIVDPEGEYYGLKERYEILHVGNDDLCDVQVSPSHAEQLAEIALEQNMPIILDVSDYLDGDEASELIANVVRELFKKEKDARKPFLLVIEEMQEYLPQQGGNDELSELLERVAKRGRKRGLGMLGMSQRPSSVDKDFITQCDWMVWHRLTWQNDVEVVRKVLGSDVASEVEDLDTGQGYLMTDWDESVEKVHFKRKETHDAGATPGLESYERPDLKSVSQDLIRDIKGASVGVPTEPDDGPALDDADQEALNHAVETVEAEGGAISERDPTVDGDGGAAAGTTTGAASGTGPDSETGASGGTTSASLEADVGGRQVDADLAGADEHELRERVEALRRRNRILEDEVEELRTILENVDTAGGNATGTATESASSRQQGTGGRSTPARNDPTRPVPPEPPIDRDGVAGNIVEFVAMISYLWKSFVYRCRLFWYRLRRDDAAGAS